MLGIAGAGWGLTISNWITGLAIGGYALTSKDYKRYFRFILDFTKPSYVVELVYIVFLWGSCTVLKLRSSLH